jgi:hypothetical protein
VAIYEKVSLNYYLFANYSFNGETTAIYLGLDSFYYNSPPTLMVGREMMVEEFFSNKRVSVHWSSLYEPNP